MQTNVELIYQQHIKPLPQSEKLKLLAKVAEDLASDKETAEQVKKRSLLELEGLGAEIWEGIDAQEYVNALRDEWEHRP